MKVRGAIGPNFMKTFKYTESANVTKFASFLFKPFLNIIKYSSLYDKESVVYYLQISLFVPEKFQFLKYAK